MEHDFTPIIGSILESHFGESAQDLFDKSPLLQYLNLKTVSATRGSKARGSFASLYAIYVLVEDYIEHGYHKKGNYTQYEGARFTKLFTRQRQLPFGSKLQNHALNHRMNQEFRKFFLDIDKVERYPISFVIKSDDSVKLLKEKLRKGAERQYSIKAIVKKYMGCIEEVIDIPILRKRFEIAFEQGYIRKIIKEIVLQSKVEFNYEETDDSWSDEE